MTSTRTKAPGLDDLEAQAERAEAAARAAAQKAEAARLARDERIEAALADEAERLFKVRYPEAKAALTDAVQAWDELAANPNATLPELFDAYCAVRQANAERRAVGVRAVPMMDRYHPMSPNSMGNPRSHGGPIGLGNPLEGTCLNATFEQALEAVVKNRDDAAYQAAITAEEVIRDKAVADAEKA